MRRFSFLQVFLTCLTIGFAVAVSLRIRSDRSSTASPVEDSRPRLSTHDSGATRAPLVGGARLPSTGTPGAVQRQKAREELLRESMAAPVTKSTPSAPGTGAKTPQQQHPALAPPKAVATTTTPARPSPVPGGAHASGSQASQAAAPKDPNSDTTPPQLISIEFDPSQVHDGEESRVIMTAVDDLSGVRGISGTITSPTGKALQGFAGQREGETNRYIGRVLVPKNGEEGLWRVNVITMSDNASNSITLSLAQGTLQNAAALRVVSSQSDSTPPTLKSVRVEKRTMRAGEPNPIYIEAVDDQSGVNLVSAVFLSPTKRARIGAGCRHGDGDLWECELSLPSCIDCGDWQLEQVTLQDKANNLATFRMDNPIVAAVKINIGGDSCDSEPPRLVSIAIDQPVVTLARDAAVVTVTIAATDDLCGVEGASAQYSGPGTGTGGFFPLQKVDEMTWAGRIPLDPRAPRGTWRITSVQLTDKAHNLRIYYANDPLLANATFVVR